MPSHSYDVIVVGAGPAGASAAYWLGEAGQNVLVLEREQLPRYKPCGGAVPSVVFDRFPFDFSKPTAPGDIPTMSGDIPTMSGDIPTASGDIPTASGDTPMASGDTPTASGDTPTASGDTPTASGVIERWVRRVRFRFRDGREVAADVPDRAVAMVMRDRFDFHILNHARAAVRDRSPVTALQQDESGVTVTTASGEAFHARYLIGADGANSCVARLVGLRRGRKMGGAIEAEVPVSHRLLEEYADTALFVFGVPLQGYLWIFPKATHLSVGIGAFYGRVSNMRQILQQEMARLGVEIDGARQHGHPLPAHLRREPLQQGRVLLVGDAAGLMDPLMGEGIRHAVDSGKLAAESIGQACPLMGHPRSYAQRVHREIGRDLLRGRLWARLFYNHPWGSFELAVRNPLFVREFLRLFAGEGSYLGMTARALPNVLLGLSQRRPVEYR